MAVTIFVLMACGSDSNESVSDTVTPVLSLEGIANGETYDEPVIPQVSANEQVNWDFTLKNDGVDVEWNNGDEITKAGNYELNVLAVDNSGNNSTLTVTFTIEATGEVVGVKPWDDIIVPVGISYTDIDRPSTVTVILDSGVTLDVPVSGWGHNGDYDSSNPGTYKFQISFDPTTYPDVTNPQNIYHAYVNVIVVQN